MPRLVSADNTTVSTEDNKTSDSRWGRLVEEAVVALVGLVERLAVACSSWDCSQENRSWGSRRRKSVQA